MKFNMKCVVIILVLCSTVYAYLDDIPRVSKLCCDQGTSYARVHTSEDCSSSSPPAVAPHLGQLCLIAMDACCKQYFLKKKECDTGVDIAQSSQRCEGTIDMAQSCCSECKRGMDAAGRGESCAAAVGESLEQLLGGDAFKQCCVKVADHNKKLHIEPLYNTTTGQKAEHTYPAIPVSREVSSLCEDYAPNELCAHHCIPVPGSYKCECNPGHMLMPDGKNCKEVTKNRCKPRNPCQHKCYDNGGETVQCSCKRGYELMADGKSCQDINECTHDPPVCLPGTKCFNVHGSYKCIPVKHNPAEKGQCPPGFSRNRVNFACDDVNECLLPNPPCPHYLCENTIGGYKCDGVSGDPANLPSRPRALEERCPTGFKTGLNEECDDVDECAERKDDCNHLSQFCINTHGSFYCQDQASKYCPPGFKINPGTNICEDINECEDDPCGDLACTNLLGQYTCQAKREKANLCPSGMRLRRGTSICEDIDECAEGTHVCDQYQNCHNTNGSHECRCRSGFEYDLLTGACVDVNECATEAHDCVPQSQRCDNTVGSYLCVRITSCGTGYILQHATGLCEDIDECALGQDDCKRLGPNFKCSNIPGSFRCERVLPSTTTTLNPDYEYYYDSEDEDETNGTIPESTGVKPEVTVTTPKSTTAATQPTTPETKSERPEENYVFTNKDPDNRNNNLDFGLPTPSTYYETNLEPEKPKEPEPIQQPQLPKEPEPIQQPQVPKETQPDTYYEPSEPRQEPKPDSVVPEPTGPKIVNVKVDQETATVHAERSEDGSVFVDTRNLPENEWTKINEKPIQCQAGFELDSFGACFDIDECATNRHICSSYETCRNTMGAYVCDCNSGYRRDLLTGSCEPVPTTVSTTMSTTVSTTPVATTPEPTKATTPPYEPSWVTRRRLPRPFRPRIRCDVGYHHNSTTDKCEDVNECVNGQANCAPVEVCVNTDGGYRCDCPPTWVLDLHRNRCVPARDAHAFPPGYGNVPEYPPIEPDNVPANKGTKYVDPIITDQGNRRTVECQWGYRLGMDNICEDINECATGEAKCGPMQFCTNLAGGYTCSCPRGHRLAGDHECADVDECALAGNQSICSQNANCVNTIGSYQCQCHKGFRSAPANDKVCVDVDECSESPPGSLCEQRCNNVWGDYKCTCHRGYRLNKDNRTCSDVDECTEYKSKILCIGRCVNEPGSYRCTCPPGYRLSEDKRSCVDIDECETAEAPCAGSSSVYGGVSDVCLNTRGGYRCERITCPRGYQLESKHRCTKIDKVCSPTDWECAHQPTTYSFNFITFVSQLYIPDKKVDLFTMRGPAWTNARENFELRLMDVNAPPTVKDKADINAFLLTKTGHQAMVSLVRPLQGPQSIELELSMELYSGDIFGGIAVAKLFIFVSEYEFYPVPHTWVTTNYLHKSVPRTWDTIADQVGGGGGGFFSREDERMRGNKSRFRIVSRSLAEEDAFDVKPLRKGPRSGVLFSIMNLAKGALGGGVMAGHVAYLVAGYLPGVILNLTYGVYMCYCFYLLVLSAQRLCKRCQVESMTYPDVGEAAFALFPNPKVARMSGCMRKWIDVITCLNLFGSCAAYQLMVGKTIKQLVEGTADTKLEGESGYPHLRVYVAAMIIPTIILCLITDIKYLAPFSILANAVIGLALIMTIYYCVQFNPSFSNMVTFTDPMSLIKFTGMSVFSMSCAGVVIPVENNMKDPSKFWIVIISGYCFIIGAVFTASFFGYAAFLTKCMSPITMNFPLTTAPMILKGLIAVMIYVTHALNFFMPFQCVFFYVKKRVKQKNHFKAELILRAVIVVVIGCFAIGFPNIDALMGFLGCFCLSNMAFILPNIIYVLVHYERPGKNRKFLIYRAICLSLFGVFIMLCGSAVNGMEMVQTMISSMGKKETTAAPAPAP